MKLILVQKQSDLLIEIIGHVDETAEDEFERIQGEWPAGVTIFDFEKVLSWNSLGIAAWLKFTQRLEGRDVMYLNCSHTMLDVAIMVDGFLNPGKINTCLLQFDCDHCGKTNHSVVEASAVVEAGEFQQLECKRCHKQSLPPPETSEYFNLFIAHSGSRKVG